jgi:WD40 repeat protein
VGSLCAGVIAALLILAPSALGSVGPYYVVAARPFALGRGGPVAFSPSGRLLATVAGSLAIPGSVAVRAVGSDGRLSKLPAGSVVRLPGSDQVVFSPSGTFMAVVASQSGRVFVFSVGRKGRLVAVPGSPFWTGRGPSGPGSTPLSVAYSPNGRFLATADANVGVVSMFSVARNGSLRRVPGSPFKAGGYSSWVTFSPNSRLVATANGFSNSISVLSVAADGALSRVAVRKIPGGIFDGSYNPSSPDQVAFSPSGGLLVSESADLISVFSVASTGSISQVPGSPYPGALETGGIAFDPSGNELIQDALEGPLTAWTVAPSGQLGAPVSYATIVPAYAIAVSSQGFIAAADDVNEIEMLTENAPTISELQSALTRAIAVTDNQRGRWTLLANGGYNIGAEFPEVVDMGQVDATGGLGPGTLAIEWYVDRGSAGGKTSRVLIAQGKARFTFQNLNFNGIPLTPRGRRILEQDKTLSVTATGRFTPFGGHALTASISFTLPHCQNSECRRLVGH